MFVARHEDFFYSMIEILLDNFTFLLSYHFILPTNVILFRMAMLLVTNATNPWLVVYHRHASLPHACYYFTRHLTRFLAYNRRKSSQIYAIFYGLRCLYPHAGIVVSVWTKLYCVYCSAFTYVVCFQAVFNLVGISKHSEYFDTFIMASDESFI